MSNNIEKEFVVEEKVFQPSVYQEKVFEFVKNGSGNAVVSAVAGSGKTTTILKALDLIPKNLDVLYLAFNKDIVASIKKKYSSIENVVFSTVHGYGISILRELNPNIAIDNYKYINLLRNIYHYLDNGNESVLDPYNFNEKQVKILKKFKLKKSLSEGDDIYSFQKRVAELCNYSRIMLIDDEKKLKQIAADYDIEYRNREVEIALDLVELGKHLTEVVDYTDMLYFPIIFDMPCKKYDWVFIDECQDLNTAQRTLMLRAVKENTGRWVGVGDVHQCQPKGAKVLMKDLSEKNIEDVNIGDEIVSYSIKKCQFVGMGKSFNAKPMKVLNKKVSFREDNVFTFFLENGYKSSYTSIHKCYVQLSEKKMDEKYCVYLMKKGENFRIGLSPCLTKSKEATFAPIIRARAEKADSFWILKILNNRKEAYLYEQLMSYKYKMPQLRFKNNSGSKNGLSQSDLNFFWNEYGCQTLDAEIILKKFFKKIEFPFWNRTNNNQGGIGNCWKISSKSMFKIQACNIIPEIMDMCIFDSKNIDYKNRIRRKMISIIDCKIEKKIDEFISLDIEMNQNYVSDGILTSNSIYGFNGADFESFKKFTKLENTIELPLSVCYRCDRNIINLAKGIVQNIEFFEKNGEGVVNEEARVDEIKDGDMVLCRNTYPLVKLCFDYLKKGVKAIIKGRDIGNALIGIIQKSKTEDINQLFAFLYDDLEKTKKKIIKNHNLIEEEAEEHELYIKQKENIEIIELLGNQAENCSEIISKLKNIFSDSDSDGIQLSTIHKSKGLESDRVFIIHRDLIPSKFAQTQWQIDQEYNLLYVAYTRAKKYLGFVIDFDAFEDKKKYDKSKSSKEFSLSKHVGYPGAHLRVKLKLDSKKLMKTQYGEDYLFKLVDEKGNYYTKFGQMPFELKMPNKELDCYVIIKEHREFSGQKLNQLAKILTVEDYQDCKSKGKNFLYYQRR